MVKKIGEKAAYSSIRDQNDHSITRAVLIVFKRLNNVLHKDIFSRNYHYRILMYPLLHRKNGCCC